MNLSETWSQLRSQFLKNSNKALAIKVEWKHGEELWVGLKPDGRPFFAVEIMSKEHAKEYLKHVSDYLSFNVDSKDQHRKKFLEVELKKSTSYDLFLPFMQDILSFAEMGIGEKLLSAIIMRINAWDNFFEKGKLDVLTKDELLGLWGELIFIESILSARPSSSGKCISAWQNVSGTDKDFRFHNQCSIEIKSTTKRSRISFKISSESQLTSFESGDLYLIGYVFSADAASTRKFAEVVMSCRELLSGSSMLHLFNSMLLRMGYLDEHSIYYEDFSYGVHKTFVFKLDDEFPVISKNNIPNAISNVSYELDPLMCDKWIINIEEVFDGIN